MKQQRKSRSVSRYFRQCIDHLRANGRLRTADSYEQAIRSLMKYTCDRDLRFSEITPGFLSGYEHWMRERQLCRNTTSFYMRILRTVYHKACESGLAPDAQPFRQVYTGIDRTQKRAITLSELRRIKEIDLSDDATLDYARNLFLLSFYLRGISFVDMAYLRKSDLYEGFLIYRRRKTNRRLTVLWEARMQQLLDKLGSSSTQYLLPIIKREDGTERNQYRSQMLLVNRKLKVIATRLHLSTRLTLYVARHSWATIAKSKHVPLPVISGAMGHENETTTRIYLASIQTYQIDKANHLIINDL